jgi:hypothetical protein
MVSAAAGGVVAMVWFPGAAGALARRSVLPALPGAAAMVQFVRQRPWSSLAAACCPVVCWARFGSAPVDAVVVMLVVGGGILSAMVDVRCHRLPDAIVAPLWAAVWPVMVVAAVVAGDTARIRSALVAATVTMVVLGVGWIAGMGFGDVKLGALLALTAGWLCTDPAGALTVAFSFVLLAAGAAVAGSVVTWVASGLRGRVGRDHRAALGTGGGWFAFGPHLVAAAIVVMVALGPVSAV